ncbi:MAG: shikimate dehydrogenase [Oscillospiraceae bacterium]|jgi:shikimate dehydrogenase|nr:shikimate dehydrogenase [Oscillospiraceae bacterium]
MSKNYRAELVGAFGCPIEENPTGVMEEAAFAAKGLDYRYLTIRVEKGALKDAMAGVRAMNMRGINLTIPHKVEVLSYLDALSPAAELIGAVNTVVNDGGRLWGENTDGKGFLQSLQLAGVSVAGRTVTLLGAGGAGRAIAVECALAGAKRVLILNGSPQRGEELAALLREKTAADAAYLPWQGTASLPEGTDILVNATPIGLYPKVNEKPDIDYNGITPEMIVTDVVFNDPNTLFLQEAARRGAQTIDGLGMLACQGALNFTLWTGEEAPLEVMREQLRREFGLSGN